MYTVLLAVDTDERRSRRAAEAVAALPAAAEELSVVVLNVFGEFDVTDEGGRVRSEDLIDAVPLPESATAAVETLETAGIDVETRREHGDPARTILAVADEIAADSIAMGGRKRSPAGKVLFGSVTQSVLLSADRPVLVAMGE